jgi:hypothetical protein
MGKTHITIKERDHQKTTGPTDIAIKGADLATTTTTALTAKYLQDTRTTIIKEMIVRIAGTATTTEMMWVTIGSSGQET